MTLTEEYAIKKAELREWYIRALAHLRTSMSIEDIAAHEGFTGQHIRHLLGSEHKHIRKRERDQFRERLRKAKADAREAHSMRVFGCSWAEVSTLTGLRSWRCSRSHPLLKMYWHHKSTADRAHIKWEITLPEYAALINPHLAQIGRFKGGKVLGRIDKSRAWTIDNVQIVTLEENSYKTNGFQQAHRRMMSRTREKAELAAKLQGEGLTLPQIAKEMGMSRIRIAQYLAMQRA